MQTKLTGEQDFYNFYAKKFLNISYLYPYQRLIVDYTLRYNGFKGFKNEELAPKFLALLPTGYGKSLCFTLPALLLERPSLFIFPLRSLLFDQQRRLKELDIDCSVLVGGQSKKERQTAWQKIFEGHHKIILSNPETLMLESEQTLLKQLRFSQIVVDEVHTLISWGKSFRGAYLELAKWLKSREKELICAYSATVSIEVQKQLEEELLTKDYYPIRTDSDRINLSYSMLPCLSKSQTLIQLLSKISTPVLIFVATRASCETLSLCIYRQTQLKCGYYHAGLSNEEKEATEQWFLKTKNALMVTTCAYGMGIDKANIRSVIHYDLPMSVEAYLQETGRAGRDRNPAKAILLYSYYDFINAEKSKTQQQLLSIALNFKKCRRQAFLKIFAINNNFCHGCDVCEKQATPFPEKWFFLEKILKRYCHYSMDVELLSDFLQGFSSSKIRHLAWQYEQCFGILSSWSYEHVKEAIESFLNCNWLTGKILQKIKKKNVFVRITHIKNYKKLHEELKQMYPLSTCFEEQIE